MRGAPEIDSDDHQNECMACNVSTLDARKRFSPNGIWRHSECLKRQHCFEKSSFDIVVVFVVVFVADGKMKENWLHKFQILGANQLNPFKVSLKLEYVSMNG